MGHGKYVSFVSIFQEGKWSLNHWPQFFFIILFFNFTILYWFCHISKWIHHRYTCVSHPEPSSLLLPLTIPLGRPSAPAPSMQYRALNLDWQLISYMILYMFQCHFSKSSQPLPLPQSLASVLCTEEKLNIHRNDKKDNSSGHKEKWVSPTLQQSFVLQQWL